MVPAKEPITAERHSPRGFSMPAIANVVVADATPANTTLYPISASVGSSRFLERGGVLAAANRSLELKLALANKTRATDRVTVLFARPYAVLEDGVYVVRDVMRFNGEFVISENIPADVRNHFYSEVASLFGTTLLRGYVKDRDPCY